MNKHLSSEKKSKQMADVFTNFRPHFTGVKVEETISVFMKTSLKEAFADI